MKQAREKVQRVRRSRWYRIPKAIFSAFLFLALVYGLAA